MSTQPLTLEVSEASGVITLRVLGLASAATRCSFTLQVAAGGNRSTHRGVAMLKAGERATLSSISVATAPTSAWEAVLEVDLPEGRSYRLVEHSG